MEGMEGLAEEMVRSSYNAGYEIGQALAPYYYMCIFAFICIVATAIYAGRISSKLNKILRKFDYLLDSSIIKCDVCKEDFPIQQLTKIDSGDRLCEACMKRLRQ